MTTYAMHNVVLRCLWYSSANFT